MKKVLFVVGSLRKQSFNRQVSEFVKILLDGKVQVSELDYADIPFVNQDIEFPTPPSVDRVRKQITEADAIWVFTPEYNYSYPSVVKNLFDWLSRPMTQERDSATA
ncbi:MAG: NAD(P)H-dependent oxidoreductase, partial [Bacteroidaceae bacterium]|nr:NAD(P)H-dependent oxidoreductase [Bacteroidaceae bacterium]